MKFQLTTISQISIFNGIVLMLLTLASFFEWIAFEMIFSYQWHKILHICGVILFFGNMIVGPVWFLYAFYSNNKDILLFSNKLLQLTDVLFTIPGVFLTITNGLFLASNYGGTNKQNWLYFTVILLIIMWILSVPLIYYQEKMYVCVEKEPENKHLIFRYLIRWGVIGTLVLIPPSIIFYFMVFKPQF